MVTDVYMFTNVTNGTPEEFWKQIETAYKKGSPKLKIERSKDIRLSATLEAKVTYVLNITEERKAQSIASVPLKGLIVSLVMQAKSEKLLKENLPDFAKLLQTYRELASGANDK